MNVKNIALLFVIASALSFTAQAQYFSLGPSVGFQDTWVTNDLNADNKIVFHPGWNAGASFVYSTESHWGIGADLKYSMEGVSIKTESLDVTSDWNLSYLRLPIRAIYFFGDYGDAVRPKVFAGPTMGLLLASKLDGIDEKDGTNGFDFGLHAGAGINFRLAEAIWLNTDITYTQGLIDVDQENEISDGNNLNGNVGVNVGVLFGL
jgi:hypothetical protein